MPKPPKFFAVHNVTDSNGKVLKKVVLTPPLDTETEARVYCDWYHKESNLLFRVVRDTVAKELPTTGFGELSHLVLVSETSLY